VLNSVVASEKIHFICFLVESYYWILQLRRP
jgi:hypothetical protein